MRDTVKFKFEFPRSEYSYLKMMCAERRISLKEFVTSLLLEAIEKYEDSAYSTRAEARLKKMKPEDKIPFDEAWRLIKRDNETEI